MAVRPGRLLILVALLLTGCAYFNTFYHAKKYYAEAEAARLNARDAKPSPQTLDLYQKSMEKCAKVVTSHEGSRWVDDALLLMGKCALARGEYGIAVRTFDGLRESYPKSDLVHEARYLSGIARLESGDAAIAATTFGEVLEDSKARKHHASAEYHLGVARLRLGDSTAAVTTLEHFLDEHSKDPSARKAAKLVAEIQFAHGDYEGAREAYEKIHADPVREWEEYRTSRLAIAQTLRFEGRHDDAREELDELLERTKAFVDSAEIAFERGVVAQSEGKDSLAVAIFSEVPARYPKTPSASHALRERGVLLVDRFGDLSWAKASFDSVLVHSTSGDEGKEAKARAEVLSRRLLLDERLAGRLQRIEAGTAVVESSETAGDSASGWGDAIDAVADSAGGADSTVSDSAATESDSAVAAPDSAGAAGGASGTAAAGDSVAPAAPAQSNAEYIASLGREGRHALFAVADSAAREEIAETLVEIGQIEILKLNRTAYALEAYESVIREFPESPYAPQALLSSAWIRGHRMGEREAADSLYRRLLDEHPESPYARGAAEALGVPYMGPEPAPPDSAAVRTVLDADLAAARQSMAAARVAVADAERAALAPPEPAATEAAAAAAGTVTGAQGLGGARDPHAFGTPLPTDDEGFAGSPMDQLPPRLLELATPEYPADLERRGIEGDVIVEVVLAPTGEVSDAHIVQSGNFELESYALDAARRSRFTRPGMIDRTTVTFHFPPVVQSTEPDPNAPTVLSSVTPEYPPELAQRGVVGTVRVQVTVGPAGEVVQAQVLQSENHELDALALDAARRMIFTPPRDVDQTIVTFRFPPEQG